MAAFTSSSENVLPYGAETTSTSQLNALAMPVQRSLNLPARYVSGYVRSDGKFTGGVKRFGLANKGIDYAVDEYNAKILTADVRKRADEIKADIIAGKIIVPDYYKKQ